jgi:hypothetical protein
MFQHLGIDACAFSDDLPLQQNCWFTDNCCIEMDLRVPSFFFNLHEAHECMDGLLKCIFRATTEPTPAKKAALKKLKDIMPEYLRSLDISMKLLPQNKDAKFEHGVRGLKVHHRVGTIMMQTFVHPDEMIYDDYRQDFEFIVSQCTKLLDIDTKRRRDVATALRSSSRLHSSSVLRCNALSRSFYPPASYHCPPPLSTSRTGVG